MDNIFKRFTCLMLALLMVLEVFSPLAVSAKSLFDEEENQNSIMSESKVDDKSILGQERTKPKKVQAEDDLFSVPGVKKEEDRKGTKNIQKAPAREKESSILIESPAKEETAPKKELGDKIIEAGRQREQRAEDKLNQAVERAKKAEQNAKASANLKLESMEIEKPGYKAWRVVNRIKATYKDGKLDCQGLLIEVEDFKGNKKTLTYDDILKDENIIVNKEIKEGLFGSSELIISTPDLEDIKIDVKVENMKRDKDEKSVLSLEKENSNKLEDKKEEEEKEGLLDKIKNFFADEDTKGLEEDAAREDAILEFNNKDRKGILIPQPLTPEEEAIGLQIIEEYREEEEEESPRFMFFRAPALRGPQNNLADKKFTIITRFDVSTKAGPIQAGQSFTIKLDDRLTVKDPQTLKPIVYNGKTIANQSYDEKTNSITYTVSEPIKEDLQIPLAIDVDYNVKRITELEGNATKHSIKNSISGIGVTGTVKLPETVVDDEGKVVNQIVEPGSHSVLEIVDQGEDYQVHMDVIGNPIVKDGELDSIDWTVRFTSTKDLLDLGLTSNATLVKGSGLSRYENITINGKHIGSDDITTNEIEGKLGIRESKNHTLKESTKNVAIRFQTPVFNKQQKYMIDFSVLLKNKNKSGAVRLLFDKGYPDDLVKEKTSKHIGMNNRTTIMGEFTSEDSAKWTVTDGVSTGDVNKGLPLATRDLTGAQELQSSRMAVYGIDETTGKMVIKQAETDLNKTIPEKETNPNEAQVPGTIAVYEYDTNLTDSNAGYSMGGVNINKYQDIKIKQTWAGIDSTKNMPAQGFVVKDESGNVISPEIRVSEGETGVTDREITIPAAKYWNIESVVTPEGKTVVKESKTSQKVVQSLPGNTTIDGKTYSYKEKYNYLAEEDSAFHIYNVMTESTQETDAGFTILKFDSKDPSKKLAGAKFTLQSAKETIELETDANGRASFSNVSPGTYTLIESKAPNGYKVDTSAKRITVSNEGKVSVAGDNIAMQGGKIETELDHHNYEPNYPSYMNALHYGKIDGNGNIEFYIYLKPEANGNDGSTNKDTRLNLNVLGGTITSVEVLDVSPNDRNTVKNNMYNQTAENYTGTNLINAGVPNDIIGKDNITDGYTGKTGYQLKFPAVRFGGQDGDWGFLVKVKAVGSESTAVSYDWLTDNDRVKDEARIQKAIGLSTSSESGVTLNIGNEPFPKIPVEVTKVRADKEVLSDATFRLRDSENKIIGDAKSGEDGKASFGELSPGKYTIEEINAPSGYQKSNVIFDVTVGEDGKVTYKARFKNGSGTPKNGVDYILEEIEAGQEGGKATVTGITQSMILQEKQNQPNDGRLGWTEGVWEAYGIESYRYKADFSIANATKGGLFKIQFDPNLDFRRYVYEIPELKDAEGNVLAKPYFNYETNLLTYQFTNNIDSNAVNAHLEIIGIIPDKYYATQTNTTTGYNFRIVIDPDDTTGTSNPTVIYPNIQTTQSKDKVLPVNIKTDYYSYDSSGGGGPLSSEYIYDIYKDKKGNTYLKAMTYYNPTGLSSGNRTLRFDWLSMNKPKPGLENYKANGLPAFGFQELEVYKVTDTPANKQRLMPLSYGIRPEQDPRNYDLVYKKSDVNPQEGFRDQIGQYRITYDPSLLKSTEGLLDYGHNRHPLEIDVPRVGANDGYVVIQTFKVTDEQRFKNLWSAYYFSQGSRHTGSYQKGNSNIAIGSESGQEIPKFYTEKVKLINRTYNPGKFQIQKLNEADRTQKLQGATFSLTDAEGHVIYRSSDAEGIVDFTDIEPGTYTLEESKAPQGYEKSNKKWRVTVYDTGNVLIREIGITGTGSVTEGTNIKLPVTNKPVAEKFQVYKKNGKGEALQDAEFTIYSKDEQTIIAKGTSDANGIVNFTFEAGKNLEEGKQYVLKETKNPQGYKPLDQKWVIEVKDGKTKVYNYVTSAESSDLKSFLAEDHVNWVDVKHRKTSGWSSYDNRWTGWTGNSQTAQFMGTRIIAINKTEKYAIQRYIINPEARHLGQTTASIHRQDPRDPNMTWYNGSAEYKVFELDKPVTGLISDVRLANYKTKDITDDVKKTAKTEAGRYGEPDRLNLTLPATSKPIVIDVKVPYINEDGGVGTGMDWTADEYGNIYWKADYYENVQDIIVGDPTKAETGDIKGSYVAEGSLDVTNEKDKFQFKLKKVKEGTNEAIKGAVFKLTGPDPLKDERYMTTGTDGMITFAGLEAGTYTLEETQPAPGYEKVDTKWTVRITVEGKVYIKGDNTSSGTQASTFTVVDLSSKNTTEAASVNPELAMKMQKIKAASYGINDEINKKSVAFMTEADKKEALVKEKLKAVYGPDEIADKYSDLVSIKEMGMAAYAAKKTSANGLEISPEKVPEAQRGTDNLGQVNPYNIDSSNANISVSAGEVNTTDGSRDLNVKISPKTQQVGQNRSHWVLLIDRTRDWSANNSSAKLDDNINKFLTDLRAKADTPGAEVYVSIIEYSGLAKDNKLVLSKTNIKNLDNAQEYSYTMGTLELLPNGQYNLNEENVNVKNYLSRAGVDDRSTNVNDGATKLQETVDANIANLTSENYDHKYVINFATFTGNNAERMSNRSKFLQFESMWAFYQKGYRRVYFHQDQVASELNGTIKDYSDYMSNNADIKELYLTNKNVVKNKNFKKPREFAPYVQKEKLDSILNDTNNFASQGQEESLLKNGILNIATNDKVKLNSYSISKNGNVTENQTNPTTNSISKNISLGVGESLELSYKISLDQNAENNTEYTIHNLMTYKPDENAQAVNLDTMPLKTKKVVTAPTKYDVLINGNILHGSVTAQNNKLAEGEIVNLTVKPDDGYVLDRLYYADEISTEEHTINGSSFVMPESNVMVYATFKPAQGTAYNIKAIQPQEGGTVTVPTSAKAGDEVTLTAKPNEGYVLDKFTVTKDADGSELQVTDGKFTMPAGNVTVTATFKQSETPQPGEGETEIPAGKAVQITNRQVGIELKVHKRNNVNEGLDGAVFTLKKYTDETFTTVDETFTDLTATSDEKGNVVFKDAQGNIVKLNTGYYTLEETKSPVGYKRPPAPWKLQVKEENGSLVIVQKGPENTAASFLSSNKAVAADNLSGNIKYKSIVKNIDPDSKTFVQRVYIDTRAYGKVVNVQIKPKYKREEIDRPGLPPVTIKEGVKTAYRSTYQITNPPANVDVDKVLNSYDLRDPNVRTVNTARWRPFDWGFDEDLLNLEPGVYYIDIEGYYDGSLIDRKVTNEVAIDGNYNFTEKNGTTPSAEPVLKDPDIRDDIPDEDLGKLDLHIDFYDGAREFQEAYNKGGTTFGYKYVQQGSYQHGATNIKNWIKQSFINQGYTEKQAETLANNWANRKLPGQKYANALSKKVKINSDDQNWLDTAIIYPPLTNPVAHADTSLDISSLYTSDRIETVPQEGMSITNEREVYNITFSKHKMDGDDNTNRLEGAVFKLQKKEGSFWYDLDESYVSSAFNGYFGFRRLEPGTYRLLEVAPPKGYRALDGTLLEFVIKTID
uniref:SpaA isopeptide-forming pilin-related protein n=1 Tax=Peptoniphilus grossensis TaxID=1465756 RepID=UPI00288BC4C3